MHVRLPVALGFLHSYYNAAVAGCWFLPEIPSIMFKIEPHEIAREVRRPLYQDRQRSS